MSTYVYIVYVICACIYSVCYHVHIQCIVYTYIDIYCSIYNSYVWGHLYIGVCLYVCLYEMIRRYVHCIPSVYAYAYAFVLEVRFVDVFLWYSISLDYYTQHTNHTYSVISCTYEIHNVHSRMYEYALFQEMTLSASLTLFLKSNPKMLPAFLWVVKDKFHVPFRFTSFRLRIELI